MKRAGLVLSLLLCTLLAGAQQPTDSTSSFLARMDTRMYKSQHKTPVDTAYIQIPDQRWTIKTTSNLSWNILGIQHMDQEEGFRSRLSSASSFSQGFSVAWRWLEVGFSVNPAWFFPKLKNADQCYSISMVGNKFSLSATMRYSTTYKGNLTSYPDSTVTAIPLGNTTDLSGDFDAFYIFNGDKFSFPAAFSMMQIQKRSAGGGLLSVSLRNAKTSFDGSSYQTTEPMRLYTNILAVGGGYGHNFVFPDNWLIHFSAIVNVSALSYNKLIQPQETNLVRSFQDWVTIFHFAMIHHRGRWFSGVNLSLSSALYGAVDALRFTNARFEGFFVIGCRL